MRQREQGEQVPRHLPRRFAKTFEQPHRQYRMLMLLATIIVSVLDRAMLQTLLSVASISYRKIWQAVQWPKQWPRRVVTALRQPSIQYRLMMLLAMLLALLVGWSAFCSAGLHLVLVLCPWQM